MAKRKFSAERLYKLVRNLFILISILGFIASAITFYMSKSAQNKLKNIDKAVEFPRHYKELTFLNLDDFLNYVAPEYYSKYMSQLSPRDYSYWRLPTLKENKELEKKRKKVRAERKKVRAELRKMLKLPSGFNSAKQLKSYRRELGERSDELPVISLQLLILSIILQIVFWGVVGLYRYLFPHTKTEND